MQRLITKKQKDQTKFNARLKSDFKIVARPLKIFAGGLPPTETLSVSPLPAARNKRAERAKRERREPRTALKLHSSTCLVFVFGGECTSPPSLLVFRTPPRGTNQLLHGPQRASYNKTFRFAILLAFIKGYIFGVLFSL